MRASRLVIPFLVISTFSTGLAETAAAKPFSRIWVFGDSTVDAGWYKISPWSGEDNYDYYIKNTALDLGKPTNNPRRISVQVLARLVDLHVLPQNQSGTDYATGGARNTALNNQGKFFPNAVPTVTQIQNYMTAHPHPNGRALYLISSGGNDIEFALHPPAGVTTHPATDVPAAATALAKKIHRLQQHGAKYIMVVNQLESFGTADQKTYRQLYNQTLKNELDSLQVAYAWADSNRVRQLVDADPAAFNIDPGFTGTSTPACNGPANQPGAPPPNITSDWAYVCSAASPISQPVSNPENYMFADNAHYATGGHNALGTYFACLAFETWASLFQNNPPNFFVTYPTEPPACVKYEATATSAPTQ